MVRRTIAVAARSSTHSKARLHASSAFAQKHVLGLVDLGGEIVRAAAVRVMLQHQFAVGLLDFLGARFAGQPENLRQLDWLVIVESSKALLASTASSDTFAPMMISSRK